MRLVAVILLIYREILPCALAHTCIRTDALQRMHHRDDRVTRACVYLACNPLMREEKEKNDKQSF